MRKLFVVLSVISISLATLSVAGASGTIKIGGLFAVTGPASFLGEPEKKTLEMLVKDLNSKGGINGTKLEVVIYDTGGDPTKANQLAVKLIKNDKVSVIMVRVRPGNPWRLFRLRRKNRFH